MNIESYRKAADRGDFQWEAVEVDESGVRVEECTYKGKGVSTKITRVDENEFEVEVDNLPHEPFYILQTRSRRKTARELAERIIRNDRNDNWKKNLKYSCSN